MKKNFRYLILYTLIFFFPVLLRAQFVKSSYVRDNYNRIDTTITMRDGVKLYTVIYTPKDESIQYPILMNRTPYSVGSYEKDGYTHSLGPNDSLMKDKYIFVVQDVRGRYMSEGINEEVTPHNPNKRSKKDVDESTDAFDSIVWLLAYLKNDNDRVGIHGISYPGFYATASLPYAHPAVKAVSPQAPVTDEFIGDDANHNGAFFLLDNFNFMSYYDRERNGPVKSYDKAYFNAAYKDAYRFFLDMGTIKESKGPRYFNGKGKYWNEYLANDTYNEYWRSRNIRQHLKNITIPVLVVGGWFDAENLFGALRTYEAIEKQSPINKNHLVMGPWTHGSWFSGEWTKFGTHEFGDNLNKFYHDSIETAFFNYYLKDKGTFTMSEAVMYETGANRWRNFDQWPPQNVRNRSFYLNAGSKLVADVKKTSKTSYSEYISDPAKPVPYTNGIFGGRNNEYMVEDQRFAAVRPDVLVFETDTLTEDITIAGIPLAHLFVSTTGTDADFIVKIIDVLPANEPNQKNAPRGTSMANMQRLVRAEVIRGKFRNDFSTPSPFVPGKITEVKLQLNDVLHTFKKGHRIMVQIQSTWFPLVDRNPQKFMRIPEAEISDYQKATIRVYHNASNLSRIILPQLID